ncbi:proteasome subunit beta [Streptomyces bullii]|uniref:Proteasome subunit beta n=1 Tax=Streptomyces bullii TaxID=349910 RepID=A0ABW0V160_9ACTN
MSSPTACAPRGVPHGTTVLALTYRDGVLIAGDRGTTRGNLIARRDLEEVHPADDHAAVVFAGSVGLALDLVKLYQGELTHFEKAEGIPMTLAAKANRLAGGIWQHLGPGHAAPRRRPAAGRLRRDGPDGEQGSVFGFDVAGGTYEKSGLHAEGSGSPYARGALKKPFRPGMSRREAALAALQYDAADDDSAAGGPDITRRVFPIVAVITEDGFERLAEAETEQLSREMVEQRGGRTGRTRPCEPTGRPDAAVGAGRTA